jgi:hypothetical protein
VVLGGLRFSLNAAGFIERSRSLLDHPALGGQRINDIEGRFLNPCGDGGTSATSVLDVIDAPLLGLMPHAAHVQTQQTCSSSSHIRTDRTFDGLIIHRVVPVN